MEGGRCFLAELYYPLQGAHQIVSHRSFLMMAVITIIVTAATAGTLQ
jgi:hypothetical protein